MDIAQAIKAINPSAEFQYSGNDFSTLKWLNGTTPISQADIETKQAELQAEYDALGYARVREIAYPNWKEFAEAYTEKEIGEDSTKWDAYVTKYNLVRNNNPKP
jgi:hypothetical protein